MNILIEAETPEESKKLKMINPGERILGRAELDRVKLKLHPGGTDMTVTFTIRNLGQYHDTQLVRRMLPSGVNPQILGDPGAKKLKG